MDSSVVGRHSELITAVDVESRINATKIPANAIVVTEPATELISAQYINLHRLPENLQKVQIVTDPLSSELLNHQVVELTADNEFVNNSVGSQYYDEELLPHDLTEEDKRLAAALVAVQLVQQQKQQHSILATELLKGGSIAPLSPLQNVSIEKPSVAAMVTSYFQAFDDETTPQHQLIDQHNQERILKLYQTTQQTSTQPSPQLSDLRLVPLPPLKKVLSNQTLLRNRLDRSAIDSVGSQVSSSAVASEKEIKIQDGKSDPNLDSSGDQQEGEDIDSESEEINNESQSSKRSLPHKKRIPRKLKAQPARQLVPRTYKCGKCNLAFNNQSAYFTHRLTHSNTKLYTCEICGAQCSNQIKFFEHLKAHYEPNVLQMTMAPELQDHTIIQYEATPGPVIQQSFTLKSAETQPQTISNLTCNVCGRGFRRQKAYEAHITNAHSQIDEFSEPEDMMEGIRHVVNIQETASADEEESEEKIRPWRYPDNMNIIHSDTEDENNVKKISSENETFESVNEQQDIENEKAMKSKKVIQCPHCSRTFTHRNSLLYHVRSHSGRRPHQCDVCGKAFFAANALRVHMRMHSGDKPYKCQVCSRNFRQWGDLKYHMTSIHSTTKQYQCEFCGKDFARKYSLIVHRRIHTGEKNYVCEFCRKPFRASSYLVNHRRIHTGEKPYNCDVCHKPFRVKSDMKRHRNTHNKEPNVNALTEERINDPTSEAIVPEPESSDQPPMVPESPVPLNLHMRQDNGETLSFSRDLEREANTLYVWIPEPGETILPD